MPFVSRGPSPGRQSLYGKRHFTFLCFNRTHVDVKFYILYITSAYNLCPHFHIAITLRYTTLLCIHFHIFLADPGLGPQVGDNEYIKLYPSPSGDSKGILSLWRGPGGRAPGVTPSPLPLRVRRRRIRISWAVHKCRYACRAEPPDCAGSRLSPYFC